MPLYLSIGNLNLEMLNVSDKRFSFMLILSNSSCTNKSLKIPGKDFAQRAFYNNFDDNNQKGRNRFERKLRLMYEEYCPPSIEFANTSNTLRSSIKVFGLQHLAPIPIFGKPKIILQFLFIVEDQYLADGDYFVRMIVVGSVGVANNKVSLETFMGFKMCWPIFANQSDSRTRTSNAGTLRTQVYYFLEMMVLQGECTQTSDHLDLLRRAQKIFWWFGYQSP